MNVSTRGTRWETGHNMVRCVKGKSAESFLFRLQSVKDQSHSDGKMSQQTIKADRSVSLSHLTSDFHLFLQKQTLQTGTQLRLEMIRQTLANIRHLDLVLGFSQKKPC